MREAPTTRTISGATTNGTYRRLRIIPAAGRASIPHTAMAWVVWPEGHATPKNVYPPSKRTGGRARATSGFTMSYRTTAPSNEAPSFPRGFQSRRRSTKYPPTTRTRGISTTVDPSHVTDFISPVAHAHPIAEWRTRGGLESEG